MDAQKDTMILLDLMLRPGFCVRSGRITHVNQAAESYLLSAGMELAPLLQTGAEEYSDYTGGCLYLTLTVGGRTETRYILSSDECTQVVNNFVNNLPPERFFYCKSAFSARGAEVMEK
jgi:hypothetical protein